MSEPSYLRLDWCPACGDARLILRVSELRCKACKRTFPENTSRIGGSRDVLSTLGEPGTIMEVEGVHLAMSFVRLGPVVPGSTHKITIAAQNCWNAERTLSGRLHPAGFGGPLFGGGIIELVRTPAMILGPLEVGRLTLRLRIPERAANRYRVSGLFSVSGRGGQRAIYTERPTLFPQPTRGFSAFLALLFGDLSADHHHHTNSYDRYTVEFNIDPSGAPAEPVEIPEQTYERVHEGNANVR